MINHMKLAIIGAGEIGQALAGLAQQNQHEVCFWDTNLEKCSAPNLAKVLTGVNAVLFAVPSGALEKMMQETDSLISKKIPFLLITKGLDPETGETPAEIVEKFRRPAVFLGGPLLAEEVVSGVGGFMAAAGPKENWSLVENFFERGNLRVRGELDIFGASAAGILKNFYAFLIGVAAGSGMGENLQSEIFSAAVAEMAKVLPRFGGKSETAWGPAGMGDMHATAFSKYSRNRTAGENWAKEKKMDDKAESVRTWPVLKKRLGKMEDLPLLRITGAIMEGRAEPTEIKKIIDP